MLKASKQFFVKKLIFVTLKYNKIINDNLITL